jgi:hypothetical protein
MSKTFDVFPATDHVPTLRELLHRSSQHLNEFLRSHGIGGKIIELSVGMRDQQDRVLPVDLDGPCWWPEEHYAWFHVAGIPGGTDAYAWRMDDCGRSMLTDDLRDDEKAREVADLIGQSLGVGRQWSFRRSAGQGALVSVAYGILAGSLAQLMGGIVHSIDGGWDYRLLPARADEFLRFYFRPELAAADFDERDWVCRCVRALPDEVAGAMNEPTR